MNINATLLGQFIFIFALIMGAVCYYLGRRKTQTPVLAGLLGVVLSLIPILGLVYLVVLVLKKDVGSTSAAVSE
ncbi:hypothetical protein [Rheinheimera baltica]|uniref:Uncharacterized protein n=1 Tax=Rheinheimera baltica TaxID=67576 RepID=A0ABT9I470_9GAMM|nr:hypothetical protein [Rheinheimera baltica]MDP5137776.1 hypothetical protein [Rheinheimera baltica]MDP5144049.1 hypothetical protein [Rheinheimera baltica]MDP5148859.1 hypothetical protein [Rheinheimera baltica]MDP5190647.1 hypothetical protein [Rheinheimera baltica]